jgi:hypothetical protein
MWPVARSLSSRPRTLLNLFIIHVQWREVHHLLALAARRLCYPKLDDTIFSMRHFKAPHTVVLIQSYR